MSLRKDFMPMKSKRLSIWLALIVFLFVSSITPRLSMADDKGTFFGELVLRPLKDGVRMSTTKHFGFKDNAGREWIVPSGSTTDGASIPRALWSVVGSPFTGKYLPAAVVHDRFCDSKYRSWKLTHDVFYEAMIANGVDKNQALLMWAAAYRFGPRWTRNESRCWDTCAGGQIVLDNVEITPEYSADVMNSIKGQLEANPNTSKAELENFIDTTFAELGSPEGPGAKMRGYISGSIDDEDGKFTRKNGYFERGGDDRRYAEGAPPFNWPTWGLGKELDIHYHVTKIKKPDILNMRSEGDAKSKKIGEIPADGRGIKILGVCNSIWCKVRYGSIEGWVNTSYLAIEWESTQGPEARQ